MINEKGDRCTALSKGKREGGNGERKERKMERIVGNKASEVAQCHRFFFG
jgi:hypothetical protein